MAQPIILFEIGGRDRDRSANFYSQLFDWKIKPQGPVQFIEPPPPGGIPGHITSLGHDPQNYVTIYVEVDDIEASLAKAESLGGTVAVRPIEIPNGTFAWFKDPDGNVIGLWQPLRS
jgi:predicted enzyme related to lactoylglutathione lyase